MKPSEFKIHIISVIISVIIITTLVVGLLMLVRHAQEVHESKKPEELPEAVTDAILIDGYIARSNITIIEDTIGCQWILAQDLHGIDVEHHPQCTLCN